LNLILWQYTERQVEMSLIKQRRFAPYFLTQFLGAFNDNVFKNALVIILTYKIVSQHSAVLVNLAAVIFILLLRTD